MDDATFTKRRSQAEFIEWIEGFFSGMGLMRRAEFLERRGLDKRMAEEALPLYFYVKRYYRGEDVRVELAGGSGSVDATIFDAGGKLIEYVQITVAVEEDQHIARRGIVGGLDSATYWKLCIESKGLDGFIPVVDGVIAAKMAKRYEIDTTLAIMLSNDWIEEEEHLDEIVAAVRDRCTGHRFRRIVFLDPVGRFREVSRDRDV